MYLYSQRAGSRSARLPKCSRRDVRQEPEEGYVRNEDFRHFDEDRGLRCRRWKLIHAARRPATRRKTRKVCHQHSTVESCAAHEQDAIRRLEEAMNEAQALLCKDERALIKNLLLSYKWWDIKHFTKCSSDIQVNSITDFLFNRPRIHSDCRLLKSRLFRCLNESYAAADEADPKPDVDGARQVLAIFLDRMTCVDARDLPHVHDATTAPDDAGEADYPADEAEGNATDANGSAMPVLSHGAESGTTAPAVRKPALAGLVLLMVMSDTV
ncbi:hypothetical protein V5799_013726 [Amblyomma americanum]|uniref:Uncharacterized protein n=1 Tax=Amblyomma americanum TaxID=6943 RepID=A0AAQ4E536_AMBAM